MPLATLRRRKCHYLIADLSFPSLWSPRGSELCVREGVYACNPVVRHKRMRPTRRWGESLLGFCIPVLKVVWQIPKNPGIELLSRLRIPPDCEKLKPVTIRKNSKYICMKYNVILKVAEGLK